MAVQEKNGPKLFVSVAEIARQYPFWPNYNLEDRLWYEYNLLQENLDSEIKFNQENQKTLFSGRKTTLSDVNW